MWKKLSLLAAVAGVVSQAMKHLNKQGTQRRKRDARQDVQRWEDEGGSLPVTPAKPAKPAKPAAASRSTTGSTGARRRTRSRDTEAKA